MEESNKNNKNPRSIVISKEAMDRRRQLEEEEFDPYSMGVDSIFQVSRSAAGAQRHGHVVEVLSPKPLLLTLTCFNKGRF